MNKIKRIISIILALSVISSLALASETTASAASDFTSSSYDFSQKMSVGINIGNTLDSVFANTGNAGVETYWGCPKITEKLIVSIVNKGFDTIRIPCTWVGKTNINGQFLDNGAHLTRYKQVVDWAYSKGVFVIINTHHEQSWLTTYNPSDAVLKRFATIWTSIANTFKDYNERLIFEGYNELLWKEGDWAASGSTSQAGLKKIGQKFIDTVRSTGGNNAKRYLLLNTYGAVMNKHEISTYQMPSDSAKHIMFGVHTYDPQSFCFSGGTSSYKSGGINGKYKEGFPLLKSMFLDKGYGVIMGEFGAVFKDNNPARVTYVQDVATYCAKYGVIPVWWDSGFLDSDTVDDYGLVYRRAPYDWNMHDTVTMALLNKVKEKVKSRPGGKSPEGLRIPDSIPGGTVANTTAPTQATQATTTQPTQATQPTQVIQTGTTVFTDWSGKLSHCKSQGWASPHNVNNNDMASCVSVSNGSMTVNTAGKSFNSQLVQVEIGMDKNQAAKAIAAAQATDNYLYVSFTLNSASCSTAKFKMYCFADGNWQEAKVLVAETDFAIPAGKTINFKFHVDNLDGLVPDTIAINAMNEYYDAGITAVNYTVSSITSKGSVSGGDIIGTQPTQPTQATQPTQPTQATQPTQPTQATQATEPTQATQQTQPTSSKTVAIIPIPTFGGTDSTTQTTQSTTTSSGLLGDCNLDSFINSFDIMLMKRAILDDEYKTNLMSKGDINKDGQLNSFDIMLVKKLILESK